MSTVKCPGCGGQFPLTAVAQYEQFTCSQCGHIVSVPAAAPAQPVQRPAQQPAQARRSAAAAAPSKSSQAASSSARSSGAKPAARRRAPEPEPEPEPRGRSRGGRSGGTAGSSAPARKSPPVPLLAGGGLLLVVAVAFFALKGGDELPDAVPVGAPGADGVPAIAGGPATGDPNKDPAAWAMLDALARKDRVNMMVARAETESDAVLQQTAAFLLERNETEVAGSHPQIR